MHLTIENCALSNKQKNYFSEIGLFFQEISFITEFPGSNFLATHNFNRWQMGFSGSRFATCYC